MVVIIILGFVPLMMLGTPYIEDTVDAYQYHEFSTRFKEWLIISVTSAGPMLVEFILDYRSAAKDKCGATHWLSRGLLLAALIAPNILMYILLVNIPYPSDYMSYILQASLVLLRQVLFITSLLMSMFYHKMESVSNPSITLTISVANWTVVGLCMWVVNRILFLILNANFDALSIKILTIFCGIFGVFTLIIFGYLAVSILLYLSKQRVLGSFYSHEHLSDFYNTLMLAAFLIAEIIFTGTFLTEKDGGYVVDSAQGRNEKFIASLYVQIGITIVLTVIPERSYRLLAELKQQKLSTRLNLIRYVSHEMRTPLNTAYLGLEMLSTELKSLKAKYDLLLADQSTGKRGSRNHSRPKHLPTTSTTLSEDVHEIEDTVKQVQDSCKVAVETLDDLLTFDKLDENKLVIEVDYLDPWTFLCDAAKPFEINARVLNIKYVIEVEDNGGLTPANCQWLKKYFIKGDKFKLAQVIRNLCSNALKFTPSGGTVSVKLALIAQSESSRGRQHNAPVVRMTVTDSGAGISKEHQCKLFGQYVQFNASKLQQGKGSGLGLWISKSIVELHEGTIWVNSEGEGFGTTFGIDLPCFSCNLIDQVDHSFDTKKDHVEKQGFTENEDDVEQRLSSSSTSEVATTTSTSWTLANQYHQLKPPVSQSQSQSIAGLELTSTATAPTSVTSTLASLSSMLTAVTFRLTAITTGSRTTTSASASAATTNITSCSDTHLHHQSVLSHLSPAHNSRILPPPPPLATSSARIMSHLRPTEEYDKGGGSGLGSGASPHFMMPPATSNLMNISLRLEDVNAIPYSSTHLFERGVIMKESPMSSASSSTSAATLRSQRTSPSSSFLVTTPIQSSTPQQLSNTDMHVGAVDSLLQSSASLLGTQQPPLKKSWETGLHFLIVDDTLTSRKMLKKLLSSGGHNVSEAIDGLDCLQQLDYWRSRETIPTQGPLGVHSSYVTVSFSSSNRPVPATIHETSTTPYLTTKSSPSSMTEVANTVRVSNNEQSTNAATTEVPIPSSSPPHLKPGRDSFRKSKTVQLADDVDVVLMDEHMPRMEGSECCRLLTEKGFTTPIIAVTGSVDKDSQEKSLAAGAVAVLQKPLNMEVLRQTVESLFV
jgi:signal transduction histidine kinase/CheY-like chemotaxis protein